jgi:hypothetical protein
MREDASPSFFGMANFTKPARILWAGLDFVLSLVGTSFARELSAPIHR